MTFELYDMCDTFANGKSVRKMAEEVELLDFYRQTYTILAELPIRSDGLWRSMQWNHALIPFMVVIWFLVYH